MATINCPTRSCLTVNRLIALRNSSRGSCEICTKTFQSIRWRAERACLRAILIGLSKVCSGVRRGGLWKICALTKRGVAFLFQSELWIPLPPPLVFQTGTPFGVHLSDGLEQNHVPVSTSLNPLPSHFLQMAG